MPHRPRHAAGCPPVVIWARSRNILSVNADGHGSKRRCAVWLHGPGRCSWEGVSPRLLADAGPSPAVRLGTGPATGDYGLGSPFARSGETGFRM